MLNTEKSDLKLSDVLLILVIGLAFYFSLSFTRPLASPDEGRYSEIPREMAASGDWVTPRLNGVQYFYKPPMFYWMQTLSIEAFGVNRMSLRFPNSLMAVLGLAITYLAVGAMSGRKAGLFSAAVLGTSIFYFAMGNIITLDMTVSVFISASLFCFLLAWHCRESEKKRGLLWILFFIFCALSVMTKGLIGVVIPAGVILLYLIALNPLKSLRQIRAKDFAWWGLGLAIFALIAVPWHVLAAIANPPTDLAEGIFSKNPNGQGFFWYYIINEHFLRYLDADVSDRYQPFYFFWVLAPIGLIPWVVVLPRAVWDSIKNACAKLRWNGLNELLSFLKSIKEAWVKLRDENPQFIFYTIWVLFILLFFSMSKSKLVPYILPIYPPLAAIVGIFLAKVWDRPEKYNLKPEAYTLVTLGFTAAIATVPVFEIFSRKGKILDPELAKISFGLLGVFLLVGSIITLFCILKKRKRAAILFIFATVALFLGLFNPLARHIQRPDTQPFAEIILKENPNAPAIASKCYSMAQDLPVWLGRVIIVHNEIPQEQHFGYMREEAKHKPRYIADAELEKLMASGVCYIVVKANDLEALKKLKGAENLEQKARKGKLILLKNTAK